LVHCTRLGRRLEWVCSSSGAVRALLLDNGYLTQIRTAAAGAAATDILAAKGRTALGVLGAGRQALLQTEALGLVRQLNRVRIWARDPQKAGRAADHLRKLGMSPAVCATAEEVVRASNVIITATSASVPLIKSAWLHPGLHISAIGSDSPAKCELEPAVLARASVYACDSRDQCATLGEWRAARAAGVQLAAISPEIGEIIAGTRAGRIRGDDITVADLTGVGLQDTAIALVALARYLNVPAPDRSERGISP